MFHNNGYESTNFVSTWVWVDKGLGLIAEVRGFFVGGDGTFCHDTLTATVIVTLSTPTFTTSGTMSAAPIALSGSGAALSRSIIVDGATSRRVATMAVGTTSGSLGIAFNNRSVATRSATSGGFLRNMGIDNSGGVIVGTANSAVATRNRNACIQATVIVSSANSIIIGNNGFITGGRGDDTAKVSLRKTAKGGMALGNAAVGTRNGGDSDGNSATVFTRGNDMLGNFGNSTASGVALTNSGVVGNQVRAVIVTGRGAKARAIGLGVGSNSMVKTTGGGRAVCTSTSTRKTNSTARGLGLSITSSAVCSSVRTLSTDRGSTNAAAGMGVGITHSC